MSCKWSWIFLISLDKQINWFNTRADFNMQQFTVGNVDLQSLLYATIYLN